MKPLGWIVVFCCAVPPLFAAEWPPELAHYEALILQQPGDGVALRQVRDYASKAGRIKELQERWEARASGGDELRYRLMLGALLAAEAERDAARAHFRRATELAPGSASAWRALGEFEAAARQPEARATLEKAVELGIAAADPDVAVESRAGDHLAHGRQEEALEVLRRGWASVKDPSERVRIAQRLAEVASKQGRLAEVIGELEQAQHANAAVAAASLAQVYAAARDF
ncbi:MAG: tetratricopeptide repeat protein, partial [Verrucomicrobiota bacterium]|nr:tetratricopeptide repeat protein [Verrucomicrobiota bacterium]